jgi:hypothetical protein
VPKKHPLPKTDDSPGEPQEQTPPVPGARNARRGSEFGLEGTNKTVPVPQPGAKPSEELEGTEAKFIPKSPYTRG